jgi:GntR family transcriptional regulator/MocR family aminotransferase
MLRPWEFQIITDLKGDKAVYLQIADAIIEAIKQGKLQTGEALPGSRKLAEQVKVNRNTVVKALDVLLAEGWLETAERKGVFVADLGKQPDVTEKKKVETGLKTVNEGVLPRIVFDDGLPDSRMAPIQELARAYRQIFNRKARWRMMSYGDPQGDEAFRYSMVQMLNHKRGLGLSVNDLCVTRGSQMALYLVSNCLVEKGDLVAVENPGYKPAWKTFEKAGAELLPINMEADGLNVQLLKSYLEEGKKIKALYTTPHHHFPTTVSLSLSKRMELIKLSNQYGFTVVEDDYDHEFHFASRPLLPLGSLSIIHNYVYIGTLSKIVSPALRIGYVANQSGLMNRILDLRRIIDVQGDTIMEQAILELIDDGSIKKHLKRGAQVYQKKRDFFDDVVKNQLGDQVTYTKPDGGLAFWLKPQKGTDMFEVANRLDKKGIKILTPTKFSFSDPIMGMRLGYASLTEEQIEEGLFEISRSL